MTNAEDAVPPGAPATAAAAPPTAIAAAVPPPATAVPMDTDSSETDEEQELHHHQLEAMMPKICVLPLKYCKARGAPLPPPPPPAADHRLPAAAAVRSAGLHCAAASVRPAFAVIILLSRRRSPPPLHCLARSLARSRHRSPLLSSPPQTIHLIRHGEGFHNVAGHADVAEYRSYTWQDAHLTPRGWRQAQALGAHIRAAAFPVEVVIVSPLSRTLETAVRPPFCARGLGGVNCAWM